MKILCLVHDDKFIDDLIVTYNRLGVDAEFICLVTKVVDFKYIKNKNRVKQVVVGSSEYHVFIRCEGFEIVWVHYATDMKMRFVAACPKGVLVVWSTWGSDYCSLLNNCIFEFRTLVKWISAHSIKECVGYFVRTGLSVLRLQKLLMKPHVRVFLQRVSLYSTVLPNEAILVERLLMPGVKRIDFHYVRHDYKEEIVPSDSKVSGEHVVLVGNSATYSNNTFDVLSKLACEKSISRVICPLSYGESICGEQIDRVGRRLYKCRWAPIFRFMPFEDYINAIGVCDVFVFNHIRQQALGNIQYAIKKGGLVILNARSPAWRYFRSIGVKVYSINQLSNGLDKLLADYDKHKAESIRRLLHFRSNDVQMKEMSFSIEVLKSYLEGKNESTCGNIRI